MELFEAIWERRSVRKFTDSPVPRELIEKLITAATWAPSGKNRQAWHFVVVTDPDLKKQLGLAWANAGKKHFGTVDRDRLQAEFSLQADDYNNEKWAADSSSGKANLDCYGAPVVVVALVDRAEKENGFASGFLAIQNLLLAAHASGLGACVTRLAVKTPADEEAVRELLAAPEDLRPLALIPVGFPAKVAKAPKRKPLEAVIRYERF